jgi:hypothetical protein
MKITDSLGREYSLSDAIELRIEDMREYRNEPDVVSELELLVQIFAKLCEILERNNLLHKTEVQELIGHGFNVE